MDWVAPHLNEGLGNRFFQYACAKAYAEKNKKQLVFFLPRCNKTNHGSFENMFNLFPEVPIIETAISWNEVYEKENSYYKYDEIPLCNTPLLITGCRQSYKYFSHTKIQPNFVNCIGLDRIQYLDKKYLEKKENLFFIHIRLGDFKFLIHHQIDIAKYYIKAVELIPECNILVFSDEPELVKGLITIPHTIVYETHEVESLYIMSNCLKGAIVGNSTFSFWGAYLAHEKSANHIAYFPSKMGQGLPVLEDYIPTWGTIIEV